ncbi:hypothetical protein ACWGCW_38130 [Streptomyces sp. NPDC054933]
MKDMLTESPIGMLFNSPTFGGNGEDGGLHSAVTSDDHILDLASIGHTLDTTQARVPVPEPVKPPWPVPQVPLLPVPFDEVPVLIPAGYVEPDPNVPYRQPVPPPVPPDPRFPPLSPGQRKDFDS